MVESVGKVMVIAGAALFVFGALFWALARTTNFGRLPGDLSFSGENVSVYIPIASMLIASVILTIILNVVVRFLR